MKTFDRITAAFKTPMSSHTRTELQHATGLGMSACEKALHRMRDAGLVVSVRGRSYARYYLSQEAADAGSAEFDRLAAAHEARRVAAIKATKEALKPCLPPQFFASKPCPVNPDVTRRTHLPSRAEFMAAPAIIPPGVKVQVLPGFERWGDPLRARWAVMP